jgi:hypothetical protein
VTNRSPRVARLSDGLLVLFLALACLPSTPPVALGVDLDSSWRWAINVAADRGWRWGEDVVFTYGPLGWLIQPIDGVGHALPSALFLGLLQMGIALLVLERRWRRLASLGDAWIAALALALAFSAGLEADGRILLLTGLLAASVAVETDRRWRIAKSVTLGLLAGILPFVKFQLGIGAWLVSLGLVSMALLRRRLAETTSSVFLAGIAAAGAVAFVHFSSVRAMSRWVALSFEISVGFDAGMSTPPRSLDLALLVLVVAMATALLGLAIGRADRDLVAAALPVGLVLLIVYKHSFVRAFHRAPLFFLFALGAFGCLVVWSSSRICRVATRVAVALAGLALTGSLALHEGGLTHALARLSPTVLIGDALVAFGPSAAEQARRERAALSRRELARVELPASWLVRLGEPGATVTVLPWRLGICAANPIPCVPPRTLQLYTAYTADLDHFVAEGLRTAPPRFLLLHFPEAQRRLFFASTPETWYALFGRYRLVAVSDLAAVALLEHTGTHSPQELMFPDRPETAPLAYLSLRLSQNPLRLLSRLAFQAPSVDLELDFTTGPSASGRIVPANAPAGIALAAPTDLADAARILESGRARVVDSARLIGPGANRYRIDLIAVKVPAGGHRPNIEIAGRFD